MGYIWTTPSSMLISNAGGFSLQASDVISTLKCFELVDNVLCSWNLYTWIWEDDFQALSKSHPSLLAFLWLTLHFSVFSGSYISLLKLLQQKGKKTFTVQFVYFRLKLRSIELIYLITAGSVAFIHTYTEWYYMR